MIKMNRFFQSIWILFLSVTIGYAYYLQYTQNNEPCTLCLIQRAGMIGMGFGAFLNLQYGLKPAHYAISLLHAVFGGFIAFWQVSSHICPGFPSYGISIWGISIPMWSLIIYVGSIAFLGLCLLITKWEAEATRQSIHWFEKVAMFSLMLICFANIITTLQEFGLSVPS